MGSVCGRMGRLALFLVLAASLSSSSTAVLVVLADPSYCVHLRCEWRGLGKHCNPANSFRHPNQQKIVSDAIPLDDAIRRNDESETSILARIQAQYPVNTFTLVNDVGMGDQCKGRRLWCNGIWMYVNDDYEAFLKELQNPSPYTIPPKFQC